MKESIPIQSRDYWFKVIGMLQQNWALIESDNVGVTVYFINDTSGVFDEISFEHPASAEAALQFNGFCRLSEDSKAASYLHCPEPPFCQQPHPNGAIYSSGKYWKNP
jgi:hypothetical protein